jgi:two-component system alkaline phosphatase synthesis response regulator PhoP
VSKSNLDHWFAPKRGIREMGENRTEQDLILIVDDEQEICTALRGVLVREGYRVLTSTSAQEAEAIMVQHQVTLILLDLNMPGMNGLELMSRIRERWPYTVIVILTGYGSLDSALVALRQGAHDYLLKPATPDDIKASISQGLDKHHKIMRRKSLLSRIEASIRELTDPWAAVADPDVLVTESTAPPTAVSVKTNNLLIDLQRHRVTLDNKEVVLTPTEFNTLLALVRNSGRVVSYAELVEKTHGYRCSPQEAQMLIKTHISHLRQKIRAHTQTSCPIVNVRGIGYMWDQSGEA